MVWHERLRGRYGGEEPSLLRAARDLPALESILEAPTKAKVPTKPHELYALATSLGQYTREHRKSAMKYIARKVPTVALSDLSLPRKMKARPSIFGEMARIVSSADEPLGTICFVLGSTGMRIGEGLALRIEDLDFQRKLIHIRHSVFAGTLGTPKSEGEHGIAADAAQLGGAPQGLPGFKALSPEWPGASVRESSRTPVLCEQAAGKEAAPVALVAGDSTRGLPCVSAWCRYGAD